MAQSIRSQGLSLLLACALGGGLGLLYDLLRPLRRRSRDWIWDTLFCLAAAVSGFCFSMHAETGRLGTGELFSLLAGFCIYIHFLSLLLFPKFENFAFICESVARKMRLFIKKVQILGKKLFHIFSS